MMHCNIRLLCRPHQDGYYPQIHAPAQAHKILWLAVTVLVISGSSGKDVCSSIVISGATNACEIVNGVYRRQPQDWEAEAQYKRTAIIEGTTSNFYIFHLPDRNSSNTTTVSGSWLLGEMLGLRTAGSSNCLFQTDSNLVDPTMVQILDSVGSASSGSANINCEGTTCFDTGRRAGGCSCEYQVVVYDRTVVRPVAGNSEGLLDGGVNYTTVNDENLCSSGCCRSGECQDDNLYCIRTYMYIFGVMIILIIIGFGVLWYLKSGSCFYHAPVHPFFENETDSKQVLIKELDNRSSWLAEIDTSEQAGLRMTWVAYGEKVNIPEFTIRDIVHARQGAVRLATKEAEMENAHVLRVVRSMLNNGGLSFLYTASICGDMAGRTVGEPLIIRYLPYIDDLTFPDEIPGIITPTAEFIRSESDMSSSSDNEDTLTKSRSSTLERRRSSFGGIVNGQQFLPPKEGAKYPNISFPPFRETQGGPPAPPPPGFRIHPS